jgi:choline dehydrogenase
VDSDIFDYIIVGAGAAGATLAEGLSRRTRGSVLVLESGGPDRDPLIHIPKGFFFLYGGKKYSFYYDPTTPQNSQFKDRWQRGRVAGGSTSLNGLQYDRAGQRYWDSVAASSDGRWTWDKVLDAYREVENHELGASPTRGSGGPLHVHVSRRDEPLTQAIITAAENYGLPFTEDVNSHDGERVGYMPIITKNGRRWSTARSFLAKARKRKNVTYLTHAHGVRVLFDGKRATGLETLVKGKRRLFRARKEIILSGGTMESPMLLERSGIGSGEVLQRIGVPAIAENPHVGEHAVEQRMFAYQWKVSSQIGLNQQLSTKLRQMTTGAKYLFGRDGIISTGSYEIAALAKTDPSLSSPDLWMQFNPFMNDLAATGLAVDAEPGFSGVGYLRHPISESSVHATSADPFAPAEIVANYLEHESEQAAQHRLLEVLRGITAQQPLADMIVEEQVPGPAVQTREEAIAHSWASGHALHACGTVRMGSGEDTVVDSSLRVRGVEGLRVADASVLPSQPGNTMAPSIGVGAMAARIIASDA